MWACMCTCMYMRTCVCMACAWRVHGVCMACAWRVHGVCMAKQGAVTLDTGGSKGSGRACGVRGASERPEPSRRPSGATRADAGPGRAGVCGARRCERLELLQHGREDVPRGVELLGAHKVRVVGGEHLEQQSLVGLRQLALKELGRVEQIHAHLLHLEVQPRHLVLHLLDQEAAAGVRASPADGLLGLQPYVRPGCNPRVCARLPVDGLLGLQPYVRPGCNPRVCARLPVDGLLGLQPHDQLVARAVRERADDARHGVELDAHLALLVAERLARLQQGTPP
jgi:hypothetical protein